MTVKIYQGTDSATLKKGAGHFTDTGIQDGNVCFAGHNQGVNNRFGKIHTLEAGDTITPTTMLGTRTYAATSVEKVSVPAQVSQSASEQLVEDFEWAAKPLEAMSQRCPWLRSDYIPSNTYRFLMFGKRYIIIFQIRDNAVLTDYVVNHRQDYGWLLQ